MSNNNFLSPSENKKSLKIVFITCIVIFVVYNLWSFFNYQALLRNPDVLSLTERIKSEYPECNKIIKVSYRYQFGDTSNDIYTFQLDQSGGCKYKVFEYNRNVGYGEFQEEIDGVRTEHDTLY